MERPGRRSFTGPGNPYWRIPAGLTGGRVPLAGSGEGPAGTGGKGDVLEDISIEAELGDSTGLRSGFEEKNAAVAAAPVAAEAAAMIAIVAFDIVGCTVQATAMVESTGTELVYVWGLCGLFILESSNQIGTVDCHLHFHRSLGNARALEFGGVRVDQ